MDNRPEGIGVLDPQAARLGQAQPDERAEQDGQLKPKLILEIVKRPDNLHTFQVLPRRWVVERTLAWITRCRRTVRDHERLPAHHDG